MALTLAAIDELRLNVSLSSATSQFPGRWEELRDATLSTLDARWVGDVQGLVSVHI